MITPPVTPQFDPDNPDLFREAPQWPKVVGVVSIVLASIGLICGGCGLGWMAVIPAFSNQLESQMGGPMPEALLPTTAQIAQMVVGTLWTIVLLIAGILTLRRSENGKKLHMVYAVVAIVLGLLGVILTIRQLGLANEWAQANPDNPWAKNHQQGQPFQYLGMCAGVLIGMGYPIFCLIWFGVVKRRAPMR